MDNFEELHRSAVVVANRLLATMNDDWRQFVNASLAGGARMTLEIGPLPEAERVVLCLVDREGRRVEACVLTTTQETIQ